MKPYVVVLGDLGIDAWETVKPDRISSEAPVIIAHHIDTVYTPGCAGNAALNCKTLGAEVSVVGFVGMDEARAAFLRTVYKDFGLNTNGIVSTQGWSTIEKRRVVDPAGCQVLRIDTEHKGFAAGGEQQRQLNYALIQCNKKRLPDSLLISDYGKGTLSAFSNVNIAEYRDAGVFVVVNGKPQNVNKYWGANVLVLNREEALGVIESAYPNLNPYEGRNEINLSWLPREVGVCIEGSVDHVIVTDGAGGLYWAMAEHGSAEFIAAPMVERANVCGAGDAVCATIAVAGEVSHGALRQAVCNAAKVVAQQFGAAVPAE